MQVNLITKEELQNAIDKQNDVLREINNELKTLYDYLGIEMVEEEYLDKGKTLTINGEVFLKEKSKVSKRLVVKKKKK